jgi:hypothetical protein
VVITHLPGRLQLRAGDLVVARVTRFAVHPVRGGGVNTDLLADPSALGVLAEPVRAALAAADRPKRPRSAPKVQPAQRPAPTGRSAPRPTESRVAAPVLTTLPPELSASARERAIVASARLRVDRRLVPAISVEVPTPNGTLVFEPVDERGNPLELRFIYADAGAKLRAALRLKTPGDPLALRVVEGAAEVVGRGWAAALIVYAELTCADGVEAASPSDVRTPRLKRPASPRLAATERARPSSRIAAPAPAAREADVLALRQAIEELRSVAGHPRRLAPGARASAEAQRAARAAGIRLPPGHTWVRPHRRGGAAGIRIRWPAWMALW